MGQFQGLIGIAGVLLAAYIFSTDRGRINWRVVIGGVLLQGLLAFLLIRFQPVVEAFDVFAAGVNEVIRSADKGIEFLFGNKITDPSGPWGFIFAVKVLPVIIFFASLMSVLYYLRVIQPIVAVTGWALKQILGAGVTGAETLAAAANIFVGQTEAPLFVKPYMPRMTRSQIMALMVPGFASIAGSVLAAYIGMLGGEDDASRILFAKHLMTASVMSAPGGLVLAKMMMPETETPPAEDFKGVELEQPAQNIVDAAALGATDGLKLAANVAAMLVAFVALLALLNLPLYALGEWGPVLAWRQANEIGPFSFEGILGEVFRPVAWMIGVAWGDSGHVGELIGTQVIATEFVAYLRLDGMIHGSAVPVIDTRSAQIATYALCGFANIPSIAIQIGGLSTMAPNRRADIAAMGARAMVTGLMALWMMAATASLFIR